MRYSQSSCSGLFVCTAILCWDYQNLRYAFFNLTKCTPPLIYFQSNVHLIFQNTRYSKSEQKYFINGFICSNCTRENFVKYNLNTSVQCSQPPVNIQLRNYCQYKQKKIFCQCFPSDQPITDWMKALVKPGKGLRNTNRVNDINKSASSFVYILVSLILLLVIFGGFIGMIFYWIKIKSSQFRTLK